MPSNAEAATQLDELADRLLLQGGSWFKVSAYRRAATALRETPDDIASLAAGGSLQRLPGVGEAIATKIEGVLTTGTIPLLERLQLEQPSGLLRLLREAGLAPKQVRALAALSPAVDSPEKLAMAIESGRSEVLRLLGGQTVQRLRAVLREAPAQER